MDRLFRLTAVSLAGLLLLCAGSACVWASDELTVEAPNPFRPLPIHKESIGAKWRHNFHHVRSTWDEYFKVVPKELDGYEPTTLEKVKSNPAFYLDRKIQLDIYYGKTGAFFCPVAAPFQKDVHVNFAGWPYGAELWVKETRGNVHPLFYIDGQRKELVDKIERTPAFSPVHLWAQVRSNSDNMAWIEVLGAEIIPETALSETSLRHLELGSIELNRKRYDLAAQALESALKQQLPVQVEKLVYGMLGKAYAEQRMFALARNAVVEAVLRDERNVANLVLLARADLRLDKPAEARQAAERAVVLDPAHAVAHAELGLALALLGEVRAGYKELEVGQKLARNLLPEANRNRAVVLAREGKLELARDELKQAIITRPTDVEYKLELGDIYIALASFDLAKVEFTQARELAPQRPEPHYKVALAVMKQADALKKEGKDDAAKKLYEEALEAVKNALNRDDQFVPAFGLQAEILRALGRADEAKKVLDNGLRLRGSDPRMQELAYQQALAVADWDGMESAARAALSADANAANHRRLANVLASRPEPDAKGAAAAYEAAVRLAPQNAEDWAMLGHLYVQFLGDNSGAEAALLEAVKLDAKCGGAWYDLALARRSLGKTGEAVAAADEAAKLQPSAAALTLCALTRLDRNGEQDGAAAAELAQKALADATVDGERAKAQSVAGAALAREGKVAEALEQFGKADPSQKGRCEHELWYGQALLQNGELEAARERLQAAYDLSKAEAKTSPVASRVNAGARKAMKTLSGVAKGPAKPAPETVTTAEPEAEKKAETPVKPAATETSAKRTAPVIEEPEGGEPTPIQVPGPR